MNKFLKINEENIFREWQYLTTSDVVDIKIDADKFGDLLSPSKGQIVVNFKKMTCGSYWEIEKEAGKTKDEIVDPQEMRKIFLKKMLISWNLKIPLDVSEDGLSEASYERVLKLPGKLLSLIVDEYEASMEVLEEERNVIDKQSAILFSKNSRGVENACEAISLFCVLGSFWDKFGINRFQIKELSYKEYLQLRILVGKENDARERENKPKHNSPQTKINMGGRTQTSRGIVTPLPG